MKIRKARTDDIAEILKIYTDARAFMRKTGNLHQWNGGYPGEDTVKNDISSDDLYLCVDDEDNILSVFFYAFGNDPTYERIYDGKWLNCDKYGVVHRIAVSENARGKGAASFSLDYALSESGNLKIDTHRDNIPMQKMLLKNGFTNGKRRQTS